MVSPLNSDNHPSGRVKMNQLNVDKLYLSPKFLTFNIHNSCHLKFLSRLFLVKSETQRKHDADWKLMSPFSNNYGAKPK